MKNIFKTIAALAILSLTVSCNLDLFPMTSLNEGNIKVGGGSDASQYNTREDMKGLRDALYNNYVKDVQEKGYLDWLVYAECRADNAYAGNPGTGEIMAIEANAQDGANKNVERDWNWYQNQVSAANQILFNIDRIKATDPSMSDKEYGEWKSEAICWRAWNLFQMSQIWGDIPIANAIPPAITSANIEEVYSEYYPGRTPREEIYDKIIEELEYATQYAPDKNDSDKFIFTKAFAHGMLARVFAEKTRQNWNKVVEHCEAIEAMGYTLVDDYRQMWAYDENDAVRNTSESIFEITWTKSSGQWVWMMFHRNAYNPDDSYSWIKWITPSRNIIKAFEDAGDTQRAEACIVYDECSWSNYYPASRYPFMHKLPTNASSIILMRLGEIYLLHAEALTMLNRLDKAAEYVNLIRNRAGLSDLPASAKASQDAMLNAVLDERRLELAFEGFRFFDLVRHDKAKEIHDRIPSTDSYWSKRYPLTDETILMPLPQTAMDNNPSLIQNAGY